ncbi:MAG TPA: C40 family peptidase [Saprospiraceae bacterium]|nr:C40 family peptidase [Saprospiraceae bacterium]HNL38566.1 C40 family peptidase [Saprospiraceae bacterium]HNM26822.1 C40 family peptidase [Saprospiraceae bacterium]
MSTKRLLSLLVLSLLFSVGCNLLKPRTSSAPPPRPNTDSGVASLRRNVVNYGQKFVGTKYHYAGTSPNTGFDCSGFTSYVMKEFNIKVSPASSKQATEGRPVPLDRTQPGDLIFFGEDAKHIQHVALLVRRSGDGLTCVHSTTSRGVIVENVSKSSYWKPRILFARDVISK